LQRFIEESTGSERASPFEKVKHLLGTAESGIKDLGQCHREHLIDKIKKGRSS